MPNSSKDRYCDYNIMTMTGRGQVEVVPDTVVIRLGVQTTGDNLEAAQSENAQLSQAVLSALNKMGIEDIKTYQYTIDKLYDYDNGKRIDRGYSVRNILEIKKDQIGLAGSIIDSAVQNGANVVELISFEVSKSDIYYLQALNLAVQNAYEKARSISLNFGIAMEPIPISITENTMQPVPISQNISLSRGAVATPIEPGNKQIVALVTVEFAF